jgi:hypothetical protein
MGWVGQVTYLGQKTKAYKVLIGKPEMMRPRCRREDNIETSHKEMGLTFMW